MSGGGDTATSQPKRRAKGNSGRRYQATLILICVHLRPSAVLIGQGTMSQRASLTRFADPGRTVRRLGVVASRTRLEMMAWSSKSARLTTDDPRDPRDPRSIPPAPPGL